MGMMNRAEFREIKDEDGKVVKKAWKPGDRVKPVTSTGPSSAKQEFANECDINHIMRRYPVGVPLPVADLQPVFTDVSEVGSFADQLRRVDAARVAFSQLDPKIRFRFQNDPNELIEFLQDAKNLDEAVFLGLVVKRDIPAVVVSDANASKKEPAK